jgi:formate dehydrogenase major subunit
MEITRRGFLTLSGALGSGVALSSLGVNLGPAKAYAAEINKMQRVMTAKQVTTVCCYCSVGCGLICSVDKNTGKVFNIEGDPEHPINEGRSAPRAPAYSISRRPTSTGFARSSTGPP